MKSLSNISIPVSRLLLYTFLGVVLFVLIGVILQKGALSGLALAVIPLVCYAIIFLFKYPSWSFIVVFIVNYFIMGLTRYVPVPGGIVMDGFLLLTLAFTLFRSREGVVDWSGAKNPLLLLTGIWLIYCILLVFNPETSVADWSAGVRGLAVYLFVFPLLTSVLFGQYHYLKKIIFLWSVLTLLAVIKALLQKYIGFDYAEKRWLFIDGGSTTHILSSGIRYFSFFTDAASFGCAMGFSMVVFSITSIYTNYKLLKLYYLGVSMLACYGMMISGTRAAMVIPFVGYFCYIFLSKQWKIIIPGIIMILLAFVFFKYTYIGQGNQEIRRMRTAFRATEDASFQIRKINQAKMWKFMPAHPFGIGVGKAKRAELGDFMYQLPTDTSLVYVWVETGIIGLTLFLLIFLSAFIRGAYDIWFKIQNLELRGFLSALLAGLAGMIVCSYGNEMLQQFPNGPIVYMCMAFVFMGQKLDREISSEKGN